MNVLRNVAKRQTLAVPMQSALKLNALMQKFAAGKQNAQTKLLNN